MNAEDNEVRPYPPSPVIGLVGVAKVDAGAVAFSRWIEDALPLRSPILSLRSPPTSTPPVDEEGAGGFFPEEPFSCDPGPGPGPPCLFGNPPLPVGEWKESDCVSECDCDPLWLGEEM